MENAYTGTDDEQSTYEVISHAFLSFGLDVLTDNTRAFINFPASAVVEQVPRLLPADQIVVEIMEDADESEELLDACRALQKDGYMLALDDYIPDTGRDALFEYADIIKVEYSDVPLERQAELIRSHPWKKFLAEKIETREDHDRAMDLGYHYFQGYFYSKPVVVSRTLATGPSATVLRLINAVNQLEPDLKRISKNIESDLDLSYKLLKLVNSVYYSARTQFRSIHQAVVYLGITELKKWLFLLLLKRYENSENRALLNESMIRARIMEMLARETDSNLPPEECFLIGLFSNLDRILNREMDDIMKELPLAPETISALIGQPGVRKTMLDGVVLYEQMTTSCSQDVQQGPEFDIAEKIRKADLYLHAMQWMGGFNA